MCLLWFLVEVQFKSYEQWSINALYFSQGPSLKSSSFCVKRKQNPQHLSGTPLISQHSVESQLLIIALYFWQGPKLIFNFFCDARKQNPKHFSGTSLVLQHLVESTFSISSSKSWMYEIIEITNHHYSKMKTI